MALISTLLLLLILWIYCMHDNNKLTKAHDDFVKYDAPPALQEEYMSACEYYYQYCMQPDMHPNPRVEAKYDAGYKVYQMGYKPAGVGRQYFYDTEPGKYENIVPYCLDEIRYGNRIESDARRRGTPSKIELLAAREQDGSIRGFRDGLPHYISVGENKYDKRKGHKERMSDSEWKAYCDRMDARMDALLERCEVDGWWERNEDMDAWRARALAHVQEDLEDDVVELNIPEDQAAIYEARQNLVKRVSFAVPRDK